MGREVIASLLSNGSSTARLSAAFVRPSSQLLGLDCGVQLGLGEAKVSFSSLEHSDVFDVCVDFSTPQFTESLVEYCKAHKRPIVIATTGMTAAEYDQIVAASASIPILLAPNTSVGVAVSVSAIKTIAMSLPEPVDIEIVEAHHRNKKDAPSGTALALGRAIADAKDLDFDQVAIFSRVGREESRVNGEIGFCSVRGGDIIGEHTVIFMTPSERIELTHKVSSRSTFAEGAIAAAMWLSEQPNGLYSMRDMLGLK